MRTSALDPSNPDGPLFVEPDPDRAPTLDRLDRLEVISLFERHGVLLFRGFDLTPSHLVQFTNRFAERYAPDAIWREPRFGEKQIHGVNSGNVAIDLHSEASFGGAWPEIIFFYCSVPPTRGGATTICDGASLFERLSPATQRLFTSRPLRYDIALRGRKTAAGGQVEWWMIGLGVSGIWDRTNGLYRLAVYRNAVHEIRRRRSDLGPIFSFCNYVMLGTEHDEIERITFADGTPISEQALAELREVAAPLTIDIAWRPGDLLMIDNWRYMHGRRAFEADDAREISIVQILRASFAFGATTRGALVAS